MPDSCRTRRHRSTWVGAALLAGATGAVALLLLAVWGTEKTHGLTTPTPIDADSDQDGLANIAAPSVSPSAGRTQSFTITGVYLYE